MNHEKIVNMVTLAILTAIVIVFQLLGSFIKLGAFSVSLVLVPIVIGSAIIGPLAGAWLGFVFGLVVLFSGDAAAFLAINVFGTIATVLVKGAGAGYLAGLTYNALKKKSSMLGTVLAAIVCPLTNTGIFLIGCVLFFLPTIREWGASSGYQNVFLYMIVGFVGLNFVFELITNMILAPAAVRIISIVKKDRK